MNVKITKELHDYLCFQNYKEYIFGSQLHGIATENSDSDYVRVISDAFYDEFKTKAAYLPNIHSWQHDLDERTQYVWMTETQFYRNLFSGDGNMIADIVLLSGQFDDSLFLCRTYKIIKGYLGVAKRDLKLHGNNEKKRFHAYRSLYMASTLMDGKMPSVKEIKALKQDALPDKEALNNRESELRSILNDILNKGEIDMYPKFEEGNKLVQVLVETNNIREFKYD